MQQIVKGAIGLFFVLVLVWLFLNSRYEETTALGVIVIVLEIVSETRWKIHER